MDKTYSQLMQDIEAMKQQAEALRAREVEGVITRVKEAIQVYGLTAADLGLDVKPAAKRGRKPGSTNKVKAKTKAAAPAKARKSKGAPAYADGQGNVWVGRGPRPRWLKEALAEGHTLEEFATKGK